jgi:pyruvate formate lyase activating enzyme
MDGERRDYEAALAVDPELGRRVHGAAAPMRSPPMAEPVHLPDAASFASGEWGYVHSEQIGSAVDGPGIRLVLWTTGCEFRCRYCHNPDTWKLKHGRPSRADDVIAEIRRYRRYLQLAGGGVTLSGGEPLLQDRFVARVLRGARELGVHTALDTNGFLGERLSDRELEDIDLVLLDLKAGSERTHVRLTGQPLAPVHAFARRLARLRRPAWVRYVLVPGVTDSPEEIAQVANFAATLGNVERVEVLPFHQLGRAKWQQLGLPYRLDGVRPPGDASVAQARAIFAAHGLPAV